MRSEGGSTRINRSFKPTDPVNHGILTLVQGGIYTVLTQTVVRLIGHHRPAWSNA